MELDKKIQEINDNLYLLFRENEMSEMHFYCVIYDKSKHLSCIFKCNKDYLGVNEWVTNGRNVPSSFAFYWKTQYTPTYYGNVNVERNLYEIPLSTYKKLLKEVREKEYVNKSVIDDNTNGGYVFDIYYNDYIYKYDSKGTLASNSVLTIEPTKEMKKI